MIDTYDNGNKAAKVFHEHAEEYDRWFDESLLYKIELEALRSLHSEMPGPRLEIGVGPGRFARDLDIGFGLDPALGALHLAKKRGVSCCQGIGEHLPIKEGALGTLYLLFTLYFAVRPGQVISECARTLGKGGLLVIGMTPLESQWGVHLAAKKEAGHIFYEHARFYTLETVRQWLAEVNMSIIESRSTLYQLPGNVEYMERPMMSLDEQAGFVVIVARKDNV